RPRPAGAAADRACVNGDVRLARLEQAGHGVQERRLAAAACAENAQHRPLACDVHVEFEPAKSVADGGFENHASLRRCRAPSQNAISSATSDSATLTPTSRHTPSSPPGAFSSV